MSSWSLGNFAFLNVLTCTPFPLKPEWLEFPPLHPQINQATPSQIETFVQLTRRSIEPAPHTLWACPRLVPNVYSWPHSLAILVPEELPHRPDKMSLPWPVEAARELG